MDVTVNPTTGFKPIPDLVAYGLCKAYPMPGGTLLLRNIRNGKRAVVQPDVYAALISCQQYLTMDQHVARIIDDSPDMQGQEADIRTVLQSMLDSGILRSARAICDELKGRNEPAAQDNHDNKPVVAIITWERPEALGRLLKSIHTNCKTDAYHQLYVIDDSREPDNIDKNRELIAKFALDTKRSIQYFGQTQQQSLLENISRQLPEHEEAIRFLADQSRWHDQWTSGLARNIALLLSSGRRLVMLDDDTVCDVHDPERSRPDITFSNKPREADFYSDQQEWASRKAPLNPDPIARHLQCLGMSFSEALNVLGQGNLKAAGFAQANATMTADLQADSPVLMTECGSLGCPGTNSNTWLPDMAQTSIDRMLASPQKTTNALHSRMVWAGRSQPHFSPLPNMSAIAGFDNRQLLPPYFPILRGEDRLFGFLLKFIFPTAVALDYPWAVPHLPIPQREWQDKDRNFTPGASFPLFFSEQIPENSLLCHAETPVQRLNALAAFFGDLAAASDEALITTHRDAVLANLSAQLSKLGKLLASTGSKSEEWKDYLEQGIEQLGKAFAEASLEDYQLKGQPRSLEGAELIAFWKTSWGGFAAALEAWPEIREAAAEIMGSS